MAVREIVFIGHETLRRKARRVRDFDGKLSSLLSDMVETLAQAEGVGLAAPQVNVSERIIVVRLPDDPEEYGEQAGVLYEVVNPEIIRASRDKVEGVEACLSIPGYFGLVDRHQAVTVRGQDGQGKEIRIKAFDWLARVFQHEIDHLDGILYIDRTDQVWKAGEEPPWMREDEQESSPGVAAGSAEPPA